MAPNATLAVGIDLGTTYSAVGVYRKRKVEIVQNDAGQRTTPSYVAFCDDEEEYVGQAAKDLATKNTLFDSKRLLGRRFDDPEVQHDLPIWPFSVMNDGGIPKYEIDRNGEVEMISPEQVSAKILEAMKKMAEERLEMDVTKAVVTVPAYFNDSQRQATIAAGKLAKLEVLAILNEPTAAAIAFGFGKGKNATVLIFDLGGGTFDVSVLEIHGDKFLIKAHGGDTHLGGQDFDALLLKYVLKDIQQTLQVTIRPDQEPDTMHELRGACELAKRKLSTIPQATINLYLARHGKGYKKEITRALFEEVCTPLFVKAINILPQVLKEAKVNKGDIDEVVLVGGSTRIPKVRSLVQDFFDGKDLNKSVNPDEAVAQGAAIHAAALTGQSGAKEVVMQDVTSLSLGIATSDGLMSVLVRRNTPLPFSVTRGFTTAHDNQEEAEYKVCQGERARWEDNHVLGELTLSIPSRPQGEVDMTATFSLDAGGVLTVTARDTSTNEEVTATLHPEARISDRELQDMLRKAQVNQTEDEKIRDRARQNRYKV